MDRRTFMKLLGGLASMPIVGRIAKPLKSETVQEGIASISEGGMKLYEMVVSKVIKEGKKIGESGRVDSYKHPDRPDITVDVNQTDGSAEIYFDTDKGSKGYAKIDRDMETGGTDLQEAEEIFTVDGDKDVQEGIMGGIENLEEFTRIKKSIGGPVQPYDPKATTLDFAKAIEKVGAGTAMQKAKSIYDYGQNVLRGARDYAVPVVQGARAFLTGAGEPIITGSMRQDLIERAQAKGGDSGALGYEDYGLKPATSMGRFPGGITDIISDPQAFANAVTAGRVRYEKDPTAPGGYRFKDTKFDFDIEPDATGFGANLLRGINEGGLQAAIPNVTKDLIQGAKNLLTSSTAQAGITEPVIDQNRISEIVEQQKAAGVPETGLITNFNKPTMADVAGPATQGLIPGFTKLENTANLADGDVVYQGPDGQMYGPETYASIAAGMYPNIYDPNKQSLKDGGAVDLTIITMPDISGSGVESLFKTR